MAALQESRERQAPYAGAFLLKDEPEADPSVVSSSDTDKNVYDLKGKELFNRLHEVGTLAQVCDLVSIWLSFFMPSVACITLLSTSHSFTIPLLNYRFQVSMGIR